MQIIDSSKVGQLTVIGLVGFYFKDSEFRELMFIQVGEKSKLMDKARINSVSQQIHSVRWMGSLVPPQTGAYKLSTSFNNTVIMQINGETVINQSSIEKPLQLEKDKEYEIKIEYRDKLDELSDLQLFWSIDDAKQEQIPEQYILSPNFSEKETQPFFPDYNLFDRQQENEKKQSISTPVDSDKDGIPDEWEVKGYTFKDNQIVAWNDSFAALGYKKYVSNPYKKNTAADPYTDFEKVIGHMPAATKDDARDPLVAAYPSVGVGMEKFLFSKNDNVSEADSETRSKTVTKTDTTTKTKETGGSIGFTNSGFSFGFSPKYTESWSNSTSVADTDSTTWTSQIGINTAERAYLNANVRYYNGGTAPIYDLRPTSNFIFQNSGESITTITAGPNQIGNSLGAGSTYPVKGQAPISLDKANEAGTIKISINGEQLDKLQNGTETLNLETTQNRGQYATLDAGGTPVTDPSKQWDPIRTNIDAVSGSLTLNLGTGKDSLERRVAARNVNDLEDKTPEITIKEAIKKAFNAKEKDGRLYYTDQDGKDIFIDESAINLIGDKNTQKEIESQLSQMPDKKVYNAKWKRGMKITLHVPTVYYDFESSAGSGWTNPSNDGGFTGKKKLDIGMNSGARSQANLQLKPYTKYTARAYVKTSAPTGSNDVVFFVDHNHGNGQGAKVSGKVTGDKWKLVEFEFKTGANPEYFSQIGFNNKGNAYLHIDEVSVTAWGSYKLIKQVLWTTLSSDAQDVTGPATMNIPDSYTDKYGQRSVDLILYDHTSKPLDMTKYTVTYSKNGILTASITSPEYQVKGHINVGINDFGTTDLIVKNKTTNEEVWKKRVVVERPRNLPTEATKVGSSHSASSPFPGQSARSGNNFTVNVPSGTKYLYFVRKYKWGTFNIKVDRSNATDPQIYNDITLSLEQQVHKVTYNTTYTSNYYAAHPKNIDPKGVNFDVYASPK
ncbi:hypothetical protein Bmyc01_59170 [Bacillus mycoides]|uniref:binary toxin-like calcium binding domain-containing protein n=1 Tax=Bacillus proteolyticus TaxID=2026192 RepID=UPI0024A58AF4|nr:PA14 domain-containing protein [Bacillus proteolyticus]GLV67248.1 hypothetical protein Bmyc01_59170 [Bacillus mycoides]